MILLHDGPSEPNIKQLANQLQLRYELRDYDATGMEVDQENAQAAIRTIRQYSEREIIAKCLQTFEQVCQELKSYLSQNEISNAVELAQVNEVLLDVFNKVGTEVEDQPAEKVLVININ